MLSILRDIRDRMRDLDLDYVIVKRMSGNAEIKLLLRLTSNVVCVCNSRLFNVAASFKLSIGKPLKYPTRTILGATRALCWPPGVTQLRHSVFGEIKERVQPDQLSDIAFTSPSFHFNAVTYQPPCSEFSITRPRFLLSKTYKSYPLPTYSPATFHPDDIAAPPGAVCD